MPPIQHGIILFRSTPGPLLNLNMTLCKIKTNIPQSSWRWARGCTFCYRSHLRGNEGGLAFKLVYLCTYNIHLLSPICSLYRQKGVSRYDKIIVQIWTCLWDNLTLKLCSDYTKLPTSSQQLLSLWPRAHTFLNDSSVLSNWKCDKQPLTIHKLQELYNTLICWWVNN